MKKLLLTSIAALLLATGTAHAADVHEWMTLNCRHNHYFRCGTKLIDMCDFGRAHSFEEVLSKDKAIDIPARYFHGRRDGMYFKGQKCSCIDELVVPEGGNAMSCNKWEVQELKQ
jgi:hypothetical protein